MQVLHKESLRGNEPEIVHRGGRVFQKLLEEEKRRRKKLLTHARVQTIPTHTPDLATAE